MKRAEFWNHLLNSGKNAGRPAKRKGISVFVGTAFIAIIAITALLLIACSEATSEDPVKYTVTFDSNSGSSVTSQQVAQGAYAAEPEAPTRSGYVFDGWFSDSGLSTAWTFASDAVNSDITLYAKWGISTILVQGGTFNMGSADSDADPDESPVRSVTVNSFYMAETEVTFEQYDTYCDDQGITKPGDAGFGRGTRPVINVSWYDAVNYSNWLSEQAGLTKAYTISGTSVTWDDTATGYRLPTEAEWEYAARGGDQSQSYKYSGSDTVDEVGWYSGNAGSQTQPVRQKQANELGLYDMSGNVREWCWDRYGAYSSESQTDPIGSSTGSFRVLRGGGWYYDYDDARHLRSTDRFPDDPVNSNSNLGFRLARPAD